MKNKQWIWVLILLLTGCAVNNAWADDTDIYGGSSYSLRSNAIIIFDNSKSMVLNRIDGETRLQIAKEAVNKIIRASDNVNLGLMFFNEKQGGYVSVEIADNLAEGYEGDDAHKDKLTDAITEIDGTTFTPLAETLAEAGLYFAGARSHFNSGVSYVSPIIASCQKNYVVIMTDGIPTEDQDPILFEENAYMGQTIGDQDNDYHEPGLADEITYENHGSDYLDDVAKFLHEHDLRTDLGSAGDFEVQNLTTHVIGLGIDDVLLASAADATHGGGTYHTTTTSDELARAFESIFAEVSTPNAIFVAPSVPVSRMNKTYSGDSIYIGFFKPRKDGRWDGNLKKYTIDPETGEISGVDPLTGEILDSARSAWSDVVDGKDVLAGGAGGKLLDTLGSDSRRIYTNLGGSADLTTDTNAFVTGNESLTAALLGVDSGDRSALIQNIRGPGRTFDEGEVPWVMGDILHSEPAVASMGDDTYIYVGANDGMLHCFNDADGTEAWAFIPGDLLPKLKNLTDDSPVHDYYVDGIPKVLTQGTDKILFFGERRGGQYYHALKVTAPGSPEYLYAVGPDRLGDADENIEQLGQSWGDPLVGTIKTTGDPGSARVIFLPGGYDSNQDSTTPAAMDSVGRAVFAVNAASGALMADFNFSYDIITSPDMTHSFVDLSGADTDGDCLIDRIYAGDMNGQVFAFRADSETGAWEKRLLFKASGSGAHRKIFGAPDMVTITTPVEISGAADVGDMIFFGTGDRAHPKETSVTNRLYAVKNYWDEDSRDMDTSTRITIGGVSEDAFCDATADDIQVGTDTEKTAFINCITRPQNRGWYFDLEHPGEQIVGSPVVYAGVVYFTTYTPPDESAAVADNDYEALCSASSTGGTGRIYAVAALTAAAVLNLDTSNDTSGGTTLDKSDRSGVITDSMPSEATIVVFKDSAQVIVGVEDKLFKMGTAVRPDLHMHYWRDMKK